MNLLWTILFQRNLLFPVYKFYNSHWSAKIIDKCCTITVQFREFCSSQPWISKLTMAAAVRQRAMMRIERCMLLLLLLSSKDGLKFPCFILVIPVSTGVTIFRLPLQYIYCTQYSNYTIFWTNISKNFILYSCWLHCILSKQNVSMEGK